MKLYVDDDLNYRITPEGWARAVDYREAIKYLSTGNVTHLSLDHDLGDPDAPTGYDIMEWIERSVEFDGFILPDINFHTANPTGRANMQAALDSILRRLDCE